MITRGSATWFDGVTVHNVYEGWWNTGVVTPTNVPSTSTLVRPVIDLQLKQMFDEYISNNVQY